LVESARWSARALYRFLPMSDVHGIFTDAGLAAEGRRSLSALGPAVVCVSVDCIDEESVVRAAS
jgi:DeoR/GlpR family transcriptional regulator of sugar metabolism